MSGRAAVENSPNSQYFDPNSQNKNIVKKK